MVVMGKGVSMGKKTKAADAREGRPRAEARVPDGDFCAQGICPKCERFLEIMDRASRTARIDGLLRDLLRIVAANGGFTPTGAIWKTRFGRDSRTIRTQ